MKESNTLSAVSEESAKDTVPPQSVSAEKVRVITDRDIEKTIDKVWDWSTEEDGWRHVTFDDFVKLSLCIDDVETRFSKRKGMDKSSAATFVVDFTRMLWIGRLVDNFFASSKDFQERFREAELDVNKVIILGEKESIEYLKKLPIRDKKTTGKFTILAHQSMRAFENAYDQIHMHGLTLEALAYASNSDIENLIDALEYAVHDSHARALETVSECFAKYYFFLVGSVLIFEDGEKRAVFQNKLQSIKKYLASDEFDQAAITAIEYEERTTARGFPEAELLLSRMLKKFDLRPEPILVSWALQGEGETVIQENYDTLRALHKERPKAAAYLASIYGIKNFNRYPVEALVSQYDNRENYSMPFGINIGPFADYNGAFNHQVGMWRTLHAELAESGRTMRFIEAATKEELLLRLQFLQERCALPGLITFVIISAHAQAADFVLGNRTLHGEEYCIRRRDVRDVAIALKNSSLDEHAEFIFNGCKTAASHDENGRLLRRNIAAEFSYVFHRPVIATKEETILKELTLSRTPSLLNVQPVYEDGEAVIYLPGGTLLEK